MLGAYGGVLRLSTEVAEREEAGTTLRHFGFDLSLTLQPVRTNSRWAAEDTGQGLAIDAGGCCNELAMVNDYRSDIGTAANRHFARPDKQLRQRPNVYPVEVWLEGQPQPAMVFIVGEETIRKGQELYTDYSDSFWERFVSEQNADEAGVGGETVVGKDGEEGEALCEPLPVAFYPVRVDGESLERRIRCAPPSRMSCAANRLSDVLSVTVCWRDEMNSWACMRRRFARKFQGEYTSTAFAAGLSERLASKIEDEHNPELARANQRLSADKETMQAQLTNLQAQMDVLRKLQGLEAPTVSVSEPEPAAASGST